jgi:hypothetical protein
MRHRDWVPQAVAVRTVDDPPPPWRVFVLAGSCTEGGGRAGLGRPHRTQWTGAAAGRTSQHGGCLHVAVMWWLLWPCGGVPACPGQRRGLGFQGGGTPLGLRVALQAATRLAPPARQAEVDWRGYAGAKDAVPLRGTHCRGSPADSCALLPRPCPCSAASCPTWATAPAASSWQVRASSSCRAPGPAGGRFAGAWLHSAGRTAPQPGNSCHGANALRSSPSHCSLRQGAGERHAHRRAREGALEWAQPRDHPGCRGGAHERGAEGAPPAGHLGRLTAAWARPAGPGLLGLKQPVCGGVERNVAQRGQLADAAVLPGSVVRPAMLVAVVRRSSRPRRC